MANKLKKFAQEKVFHCASLEYTTNHVNHRPYIFLWLKKYANSCQQMGGRIMICHLWNRQRHAIDINLFSQSVSQLVALHSCWPYHSKFTFTCGLCVYEDMKNGIYFCAEVSSALHCPKLFIWISNFSKILLKVFACNLKFHKLQDYKKSKIQILFGSPSNFS